MTATGSADIDSLRSAVSGDVLVQGDPGYDEARRIWNAQIDRRPAVVVMPSETKDVVAAIAYARNAGLEVTVRAAPTTPAGTRSVTAA